MTGKAIVRVVEMTDLGALVAERERLQKQVRDVRDRLSYRMRDTRVPTLAEIAEKLEHAKQEYQQYSDAEQERRKLLKQAKTPIVRKLLGDYRASPATVYADGIANYRDSAKSTVEQMQAIIDRGVIPDPLADLANELASAETSLARVKREIAEKMKDR